MANLISDGLPLGLRFYDTLGKQTRFQYGCRKGVQHKEYQYTDNCTLPPFQVVRNSYPGTDLYLTLVCLDDESEYSLNTLCPDLVNSLQIKSVGQYDYIIYTADHSCCNLAFTQSLVYLRIEDGLNTWYSEPFWVYGGLEDSDTYIRDWTYSQHRTFDDIDLRIWKG